MKDLPYEIIKKILLLLLPSSRYTTRYALINKEWNEVTRDPIFYQSIEIYTKKQMKKFIYTAKNMTARAKPIGHWVQHLKIEYLLQNYGIKTDVVIELRFACPYALFIGYEQLAPTPLLDYIPSTNSINAIINKYDIFNNLVHLQLDVLSELRSDNGILFYKTDQDQLIRHRTYTSIYSVFNFAHVMHMDNNNGDSNNNNNQHNRYHPIYYGKVLQFCTTFLHLKELHLQFYCKDQQVIPEICEFDYRTINTLLLSCPHIEILKLKHFFMNYRPNNGDEDPIIPCTSLNTLILDQCVVLEPQAFSYFSLKFPQVSTLSIYLDCNVEFNDDQHAFCEAILCMIGSFTHLNDLTYVSGSGGFWMGRKLISWLVFNGIKLKTFKIEADTVNIIDVVNSDDEINLNSNNIVNNNIDSNNNNNNNNIERLFVTFSSPEFYNYIINNQTNEILPLSTSILTLYGDDYDSNFHFPKWLHLLSNLSKLFLHFLPITITTISNANQPYFSQLHHLTLHECQFSSFDDFSIMCRACPSLKSLELYTVYIKIESLPPTSSSYTLDLPQITFEKLIIKDIQFTDSENMLRSFEPTDYIVTRLTVNELALGTSYTIEGVGDEDDRGENKEDDKDFSIHIILNCQSAEIVIFDRVSWYNSKYFG
ncbi:hypothetical protein BJ944DRAFT_271389 [Cunninghamella echinulata]|nr:hypothetical protein BJ944DRAFT_271389 [Cunninghamella echinulata]